MTSRQVPFFLYWPVENVQYWINSIGHLGWLSGISNFPRFHKNVKSLELWKYISENTSRRGSFCRNKRKSKFSDLSLDSPYLQAVTLKYNNLCKIWGTNRVKSGEMDFWFFWFFPSWLLLQDSHGRQLCLIFQKLPSRAVSKCISILSTNKN